MTPPLTPPSADDGEPAAQGEELPLPAGMVPWHGGRKPADWSGEAVKFRAGRIVKAPPRNTVWKLGWDHSYGDGDIIAYSRDTPPGQPAAEQGGER